MILINNSLNLLFAFTRKISAGNKHWLFIEIARRVSFDMVEIKFGEGKNVNKQNIRILLFSIGDIIEKRTKRDVATIFVYTYEANSIFLIL